MGVANKMVNLMMGLILTGMLLPIGLLYVYVGQYVNITYGGITYVLGTVMDPTVVMLFTVILPLIVLIGVIMQFLSKSSDKV